MSVVFGALSVMLVAPVVASFLEPDVPVAEGGGLRELARELQPRAAQAFDPTTPPSPAAVRAEAALPRRAVKPADVKPSEPEVTVSIDCSGSACVISSGLAVQVVGAVPR